MRCGSFRCSAATTRGITSATGLLVTDLKHDYAATLIRRLDGLETRTVEETFRQLEEDGRAALTREGIAERDMSFIRQIEMRYVGQSYELTLSAPASGELGAKEIAHLLDQFLREHERAYGHSAPGEPTEIVNLRLTALSRIKKPELREIGKQRSEETGKQAIKARRQVYFAERGGYVDCPIYDRYRLGAGASVPGPAVVEEFDSTTVIHPGFHARVDKFGNLLLTKSK